MEADGRRAWLARNRDLSGRDRGPWIRRAGILLLLALVIAALLDVFGQGNQSSVASGPAATLSVKAPDRVRGGLLFQARIQVRAVRELKEPLLVLDPGWMEGLTQNSSVPDPKDERTDNGRIVLSYDTIPAGRKLVVWLQYQVNPTHVGTTDQNMDLWDGDTHLVHLDRS